MCVASHQTIDENSKETFDRFLFNLYKQLFRSKKHIFLCLYNARQVFFCILSVSSKENDYFLTTHETCYNPLFMFNRLSTTKM